MLERRSRRSLEGEHPTVLNSDPCMVVSHTSLSIIIYFDYPFRTIRVGEWELVLSTVPHGIFRSSPFFMAIQQVKKKQYPHLLCTYYQSHLFHVRMKAYADVGEADKALLFFKLHELQTMSFGLSKIGRVAQYIGTTFDHKWRIGIIYRFFSFQNLST